jgi:hypothetical protein
MSERGAEQTRYVQAAMAVATQEYGLRPRRRGRARRTRRRPGQTLEAYLEAKSVIVSTSPKPFNPFGL